jgi:type IV pilus assembly protein PilM
LPAGALEVTPFKANIHSVDVVAEALKALWSRNKFKSSRVCLLLPDRSALAFHVTMEHSARNHAECLELIRFKLKKSVPFRMEDGHIAYFTPAGSPDHSASQLWVIVLSHAVLHQYEAFVQSAIDAECGLVDLATLNLMNLAHSEMRARSLEDRDILYVNLNRDYISLAITQKHQLASFRTRPLDAGADPVAAAMEEVHPTNMYYQDKLGGQGLSAAFVYSPDRGEDLCAALERAGIEPALLSLDTFAGTRFDPTNAHFLRSFVPLAGLLLSRRVEYA